MAPTSPPMFAQVGNFGASWAILAAFWRPLGHHFASRVLPKCRHVGHLGRQIGQHSAILAPTSPPCSPKSASLEPLGPSWLHFGILLGTILLAESTPDAQDAVKTPKTIPQRLIFKDWVINFAPIFKHAFHILRLFLCYPTCPPPSTNSLLSQLQPW